MGDPVGIKIAGCSGGNSSTTSTFLEMENDGPGDWAGFGPCPLPTPGLPSGDCAALPKLTAFFGAAMLGAPAPGRGALVQTVPPAGPEVVLTTELLSSFRQLKK